MSTHYSLGTHENSRAAAELPAFIHERIVERDLRTAPDDFHVTVELYDRNGLLLSSVEMEAKGFFQQEDILSALEKKEVLSPMAEYYWSNWPKSLRLLLCELTEGHQVVLKLHEAQLCCCPE